MPFLDPFRAHRKHGLDHGLNLEALAWQARKKPPRRPKNLDEGGVPVEPNKPKNLSGGAAAALEFEDDIEP
jgi:hypothetical protein